MHGYLFSLVRVNYDHDIKLKYIKASMYIKNRSTANNFFKKILEFLKIYSKVNLKPIFYFSKWELALQINI